MVTFEKSGLSCAKFAQCVKLEEIAVVMHVALRHCTSFAAFAVRPSETAKSAKLRKEKQF
jgi:hypothetical protein